MYVKLKLRYLLVTSPEPILHRRKNMLVFVIMTEQIQYRSKVKITALGQLYIAEKLCTLL